jgi:hypothetical protein
MSRAKYGAGVVLIKIVAQKNAKMEVTRPAPRWQPTFGRI